MTTPAPDAVPAMDMTRVASEFHTPAPALPPGEHPAAVAAMNEHLWTLVEVTLFRAKVALLHHGYDGLVDEVNGGIGEVAAAWGNVLDLRSATYPTRSEGGRCPSCGEYDVRTVACDRGDHGVCSNCDHGLCGGSCT